MSTNTQKITVRSQYEAIRQILVDGGYDDALIEFIDGRIAQTVKKNASASHQTRKPTPKQIENEGYKADITAWMEVDTNYLASDVLKGVPSIVASGMSIHRVSALLTQLVNDGSLVKFTEKQKTYYHLA